MTIDASVDWRTDLGGGVTVALVQAGVFASDAGTVFGPVPRTMWEHLVEGEIRPDHTLTQALNCLLIDAPAGRGLVETGVGERMDEHRKDQRGIRGEPILPSLRAAGFDPGTIDFVALSHLHFDHAGGILTAAGEPAFPRARIVAQA
ncbi:MAG: MBL fold metallo-hydrolase, partial [Chloroflexota bacterium]